MNSGEKARQLWRLAFAILGGLALCGAARGQDIQGYPPNVDAYDAREVALLPRYCIYTQSFRDRVPGGNDKAVIDGWYERLGTTFHALHHYCWGLMKTNRATLLGLNRERRLFYLGDAIGEFDYVIEHASDDFILLPEILTKKGENLARLGRGPTAVLMFERAAQLKPDYWPPYGQMSDYYKEQGDLKKAREALERGLSFSPDAPGLKRRLEELGSTGAGKKGSPRSSQAEKASGGR